MHSTTGDLAGMRAIRTTVPAPRRPTCFPRLLGIGCALSLALVGLDAGATRAETPQRHEVRALVSGSGALKTYRIANPEVADRLNVLLAPLAWADAACDYRAYMALYLPAKQAIGGATAGQSEADRAELQKMFQGIPAPLDLKERWLGRHCASFLLDDKLSYHAQPRHVLEIEVPCLTLMRANDRDILWCRRQAAFYSDAFKNAAEAALKRVRDAFVACGNFEDFKRALYEILHVYERAVVRNHEAGLAHKDALVDEYDLRRKKRISLADELVREDRSTATSLGLSYSEPRFRIWCAPHRRTAR